MIALSLGVWDANFRMGNVFRNETLLGTDSDGEDTSAI